ncbi:MAG: T9SS type A sorting domain-containing protein [Bacteroidia bacterium]|nr:T9SS type A sorting domain-containing protein [Bacteroidia bacterium]
MKRLLFLFLTVLLWMPTLPAQWTSSLVYENADGSLSYVRDTAGNVIPDFSHAGYMGGGIEIPTLLTEITISPIPGDNTAHIQAAIDQAALLPKDAQGRRGAILLSAGRYEIHGTIYLNQAGVVLRGVGDGADTLTNTVLVGVGNVPNQREILIAGGGSSTSWTGQVPGTKTDVTSDRVLIGENSFTVANAAPFSVGDNIILYHPCTQAWINAVDGGGTASEDNWTPGSQPLVFNRRITAIDGNLVTVDVPFYNHLDRSLAQSYIYTYNRSGILTQIGIEDLRIDIQTAGGDDEAHAWTAVNMKQIEDSWVRNCTFLHFGFAGVDHETATRITIENCNALDPVAQVTGSRMYNFNLSKACSQVLFKDCRASNGRHHYVSNGTSWVSGCVFLRCTSVAGYTSSEGHRRWSMGILYDNHVEESVRSTGLRLLALYNRGDYGTSHGWSLAHSVAWNCDMKNGQLVVQKPPTAQNYAIGCSGQINGNGPFPQPAGFIEGTNQAAMAIESLYEAQLAARLNGLDGVVINTGIGEKWAFPELRIYPNPVEDRLYIEVDAQSAEPVFMQLYDVAGRLIVRQEFVWRTELDVQEEQAGIYLLHVIQGEKQGWRRLLKR